MVKNNNVSSNDYYFKKIYLDDKKVIQNTM